MHAFHTLLDVLDPETPLFGFHSHHLDTDQGLNTTVAGGYVDTSSTLDFEASLLFCVDPIHHESTDEVDRDVSILDFDMDVDAENEDVTEASLDMVVNFNRRYSYAEMKNVLSAPGIESVNFEATDCFMDASTCLSGNSTPTSSFPATPENGPISLLEEPLGLGHYYSRKWWRPDTFAGDYMTLDNTYAGGFQTLRGPDLVAVGA